MAGRIRDYDPDQRATTQLNDGGATPAAFGAGIGAAIRDMGDSLAVAATATRKHDDRADEIDATLRVAKAREAMTPRFYEMQTQAGPGAPEFGRKVGEEWDRVSEKAMDGASEGSKRLAKTKLATARLGYIESGAKYEATAGASNIRQQAQDTLKTYQNVVTLDPQQYETAIKEGTELIDKLAPGEGVKGLPDDLRSGLKRDYTEALTNDYFQGKIRGARSPGEIDAVLTEMAQPQFAERMNPQNTATLVNLAKTQSATISTQATTAARAAVSSLKDRMEAGDKLDPVEIDAADQAVRASRNPGVLNDWEKMKATHRALGEARVAPKSVVDQALLDEHGVPTRQGTTRFTGLPAELNDAIGTGVAITGGKISAEFLARSMIRESGNQITKLRRGNPQFAPQAVHGEVDIKGIRPAVQDAAAVAGEIFGEPLRLNSGFRSQAKQDAIRGGRDTPAVAKNSNHTYGAAIDISTAGMDPAKKARLVTALIQAGFTGFGEYDGHIHADFRSNVPASFDAKMQFGGWTKLSPEVADVLVKRGFTAGAPAARINRLGDDGRQFQSGKLNFDFDSGRHPDGRLLSSARGPLQFIEATWLEYLPQAAKAYGINIEGKSREEQLALRADPKLSTQVYAYYSLQNKKVMEANLKREVNESELYMGHFMGATGASVFMKAWQSQPGTLVTDVVSPRAIDANKSVFLHKDGMPKTVGQVYAEIASGFNNGIDSIAHERAKAYHKVQGEMAALRKPGGDPMSYANRYGAMRPAPLDSPQSFAIRGEQAIQQAGLYELEHPKPLMADEVSGYKHKIEEGSIAEAVSALREIGQFGGRAAEGAARQIGEQSPFASHVAGLFSKGGVDAQVAEDIIRGKRMIKDNPGSTDWLGGSEAGGTGRRFDAYVGSAFDGLDAKTRAAAKEAADAYYIAKYATRGDGGFSDANYRAAIDATIGNRLGTVNGSKTVLPLGVTAAQFDDAMDKLSDADLSGLSVTGELPIDGQGRPIRAHHISVEGRFVHLGGEDYAVRMGDGKMAITGQLSANGTPLPYRMRIDARAVSSLLSREAPKTSPLATVPAAAPTLEALNAGRLPQ